MSKGLIRISVPSPGDGEHKRREHHASASVYRFDLGSVHGGVRRHGDIRPCRHDRPPERLLVDRLINRQGLSRDEAVRTVDNYREGRRAEIDPALMEGLDAI